MPADGRPTPQDLPRLLTARQLADQLGLSLPRVYELARECDLPVVRLGRAMRFDAEAVRLWLSAGGTRRRKGSA